MAHATITDGQSISDLPLQRTISIGILQRVLKYLRPMPPSSMDWPSVIYRWKYRRNMFVGKFLAGIFFSALSPSVRLSVFVFCQQTYRQKWELPTINIPTDVFCWQKFYR
jgi:hypothetical protein